MDTNNIFNKISENIKEHIFSYLTLNDKTINFKVNNKFVIKLCDDYDNHYCNKFINEFEDEDKKDEYEDKDDENNVQKAFLGDSIWAYNIKYDDFGFYNHIISDYITNKYLFLLYVPKKDKYYITIYSSYIEREPWNYDDIMGYDLILVEQKTKSLCLGKLKIFASYMFSFIGEKLTDNKSIGLVQLILNYRNNFRSIFLS